MIELSPSWGKGFHDIMEPFLIDLAYFYFTFFSFLIMGGTMIAALYFMYVGIMTIYNHIVIRIQLKKLLKENLE